jgi:protocatechuate 3,4-dioxygenase beta subunit
MSRVWIGLVACLVVPLAAQTQPPPPPARDNPAAVTGTAVIRGRVFDATTGRPLSHVDVIAGPVANQRATGETDGEGRYELAGLPAGTYTVIATKANYIRKAWGEQRVEGPGKRIMLADGQRLDNIDLRMTRAGAISGKIVDEFGDPVSDVFVNAMRYQYVQGSRRLMPSGRGGSTNDIGEFRIYGLSPGQYFVSATLRNQAFGAETADRTGYAPTFYPGTGSVSEAQRLSIEQGQTVAGLNMALLPIRAARVTGTAMDADGRPLAGAMVGVMQRVGESQFGTMSPIAADGHFTLTGLTPGEYTLRAAAPNGEAATAEITVSGADIADVQLVVARQATIRGRVVFLPSAAGGPPSPTTLDMGAARDWQIGQVVRSPARLKDDGTFEISLPPGHVLLRVAPTGGQTPYRLNRVMFRDIDVGDLGIDVPAGATIDNVIVEMTNRTNEASGRVTDADGATVRDCVVIVFAQDPARWTVQTRYLSVARPGLDDLFHVRLLPGEYFAVAMGDVENGAWTDPEFLSHARDRATAFSIADGEKKTIDLKVTPAPVF